MTPTPLISGDELVRRLADGAEPDDPARRARARAAVMRWVRSAPMRRLTDTFDTDLDALTPSLESEDWLHLNEKIPDWVAGVLDPAGDGSGAGPEDRAALRQVLGLEQWAADRFNFRGQDGVSYAERNQASDGGFSGEVRTAVRAQADGLGLRQETTPRYDRYDCTLILGGGWRSPLLRARYAALWANSGIDLGMRYFLGSPRLLLTDPPERAITDEYAPLAHDEFDLLVAAAQAEHGLRGAPVTMLCGCTRTDQPCPRWPLRDAESAVETLPEYTHERSADLLDAQGRRRGVVLSARTGRPGYRPDTTDTLALWERQAKPRPSQRVLVVTTQVFVPFQTFDSIKRLYLPHGMDVDVIGYGPDWGDRPDTPEYLLQETLSAIRSARRLLVEVVAGQVGP